MTAIYLVGPPGSGKTELAGKIAAKLSYYRVATDELRHVVERGRGWDSGEVSWPSGYSDAFAYQAATQASEQELARYIVRMRQLSAIIDVGGPVGLWLPSDVAISSAVCVLPVIDDLKKSLEVLVERHEQRAAIDASVGAWLTGGGVRLLQYWLEEFSSRSWSAVVDNSMDSSFIIRKVLGENYLWPVAFGCSS